MIGFARVLRFVVLLAALVLASGTAPAQEQGVTPAKDTIFARKILMGSIDMNMDEIETMLAPEGNLNFAEAREHADVISIMLMSFPHLFPAGTNQWVPNTDRDPATDTFAAPELWTNFADFYRRAAAASKLAFDASNAKGRDEFRALIAQLRVACNSCHAVYQKTD
jgi:cytochrome c556